MAGNGAPSGARISFRPYRLRKGGHSQADFAPGLSVIRFRR